MLRKFHWGIIGTGHIAEKFAEGLHILPQAICYAAASRSKAKAEDFCMKNGFEKSYGSYEELLADPLVDIVYIATPNHLHYEHTLLSLEAGKAVLCEKPFALNADQVSEMVQKATEKNLFLMEALWSRFLPSVIRVKEEIKNDSIGTPMLIQAEFGFHTEYNAESRLFNPELGGGSIPDIGIYPVFLALFLFGEPLSIQVSSIPAPSGTDMTTSIIMKHKDNKMSVLTSSFAMNLESDAKIIGDNGTLHLKGMFHMPTKIFVKQTNEENETEIPVNINGNGYNYEAAEVMKCLENGQRESFALPLSFSKKLISILDKIQEDARKSYK